MASLFRQSCPCCCTFFHPFSRPFLLVLAALLCFSMLPDSEGNFILSSRLIHRLSDEAREIGISRRLYGEEWPWPKHRSLDYYRSLAVRDVQRQRMKLRGKYGSLAFSSGSQTFALGNDFGWLHYAWVDIGTPNVSFLVALDVGSDTFWVPCKCIQCAPISAQKYSLDRDMSIYAPEESKTSQHLVCSDSLCLSGTNCKTANQTCPYNVNYYAANTASSGFLILDRLHFASSTNHDAKRAVQATVVIGCGERQSGGVLNGIAPDGLLGLGFGDISVPSILAKAGFIRDTFSLCFQESGSGTLFFGDPGSPTQQSTPFLATEGKYKTYIVAVKGLCIGSTCFDRTQFQALVDSGTSFSFLPHDIYKRVVTEFDSQVKASRVAYEGLDFEYCYEVKSHELLDIPKITLTFDGNSSFSVQHPVLYQDNETDPVGFCLALNPTEDVTVGIIGQNWMTGYKMVFDRENLKLQWSESNCEENNTDDGNSKPENTLPANQQQSAPTHAIAPAVAGWAPPSEPSEASMLRVQDILAWLILLLVFTCRHACIL